MYNKFTYRLLILKERNKMKPKYILSFILFVFTVLLILAFVFPKEGLKITDDITVHFPTIDELFNLKKNKVVDITEIISKNQVPENDINNKFKSVALADSSVVYYEAKEIVNPKEVSRKLEFPKGDRSVF